MGFLQGDTNNIILDAVLTDTGRKFLSQNNQSFKISKFALGDDEVDYGIIQKYGRTVGKEKIEKNTPIFEALTNGSLAQKYRCVSVSDPNLVFLPTIELVGGPKTISINSANKIPANIQIQQVFSDPLNVSSELVDATYMVQLNSQFLDIVGETPEYTESQNQTSSYLISSVAGQASDTNGSVLTFSLRTRTITDAQFQIYGAVNGTSTKTTINTYVKVTGLQSGATIDLLVAIQKF
jgi:hypothetical protein